VAKTTAPLLSFDAAGTIAKTAVFAKWKGRGYVRRYVIPSNPQTSEQTLTRNTFGFLQSVYKIAPSLVTDAWDAYARGKVMTGRNAFGKFNIAALRGEVDLDNITLSPGALGGLPPASMVITPGSGQLSVAVTAPAVLPADWTIQGVVVAAIREQDPQSGTLYTITAGEDLTSTYTIVLTGLAAFAYEVRAFIRWVRPDLQIAYSPDIAGTGTPS